VHRTQTKVIVFSLLQRKGVKCTKTGSYIVCMKFIGVVVGKMNSLLRWYRKIEFFFLKKGQFLAT
jgi:hypothetical protein